MVMYKNIKPELVDMEQLAQNCGLFKFTPDTNNGYGCSSRSKQKSEPGRCFGWDCPLAVTADLLALKELDSYLYKEYKEEYIERKETCNEEDYQIDDWFVKYREVAK